MKNKQGISLIVLVITIIVMIILAAAIILTLNNSGIINRANEAVENTDLAQVKNLAALKWSEAYLNNEEDLRAYVIDKLAEEGINTDKYDITVTGTGVDVELKEEVPSEWNENVVAVKDGVPIPKGFVASPYNGERTKNGGLVIYELAEDETEIPSNETQYTSWTTRNQYVWVPVSKEKFASEFIKRDFGQTGITISNTVGVEDYYWEVALDLTTNMPLAEQNSAYVTSTTLTEVQAMYASVKEYGGFYIARYEAGIDSQRTNSSEALITGSDIHSKMGKIPYTNIDWSTPGYEMNIDTNGAVEAARSIYPESNTECGVVSTLTYGVQWDTALQWWIDTKGLSNVRENIGSYGNYKDYEIMSAGELNNGAKRAIATNSSLGSYVSKETVEYPKESGESWFLSTGALKIANMNNIYDMLGNVEEWTMEGHSLEDRVTRGGSAVDDSTVDNLVRDYEWMAYGTWFTGIRLSLYIKQ